MRARILFSLLLPLAFVAPAVLSQSGESLLVLTEDWAPYNYEEGGEITGMSTELVRLILQRAGIDFELDLQPWPRAYRTALNQPGTAIYTTSRTAEREDLFEWVGPLFPRSLYLYRLSSRDDIKIERTGDLKRYLTGVLRDGSTQEFLLAQGLVRGEHFEVVSEWNINFEKLFQGRIDLMPGNEMTLKKPLEQSGYDFADLEVAFSIVEGGGLYLAINPKTPEATVERIRTAFASVSAEGWIDRIRAKYEASASPPQ